VLDLRPILLVNGILLALLGLAMLLPAVADLTIDHSDAQVFLAAAAITLFVGVSFTLTNWGHAGNLNVQQAFILTTSAWVFAPAFAALPFVFCELGMDYTDAFFEAMSGLTTTGSTVVTNLNSAPPGILLWRALLQWLGGIGIIVMAVAVLPMLQVGGMQLFRLESSEASEKMLPRATQIAGSIAIVYVGFSVLCMLSYWAAGMSSFDAIAHAMTTIATGGFSTSDQSIGGFNSAAIDATAVFFMVMGSLPFLLYFQVLQGKPKPLLRDSQVQWFVATALILVAIMTVYQLATGANEGLKAFRYASFNVISIMTGTGYATTDYGAWGPFAVMAFFCIMFIGGCAGSTSCGIKIFRFQVIYSAGWQQIRRMVYPHGVFSPKYNGRTIGTDVISSVMSFFFLFFFCYALLAIALSALGLEPLTALSAAGSAIANVGPGLGNMVGPAGTFAPLPDMAKWLLCLAMLIGRLELFTVLVLFAPSFWRA